MNEFFDRLLSVPAALVLVAMLLCLFGYVAPGYRGRTAADASFTWILWLAAGVICLIAWVRLVFAV